jgi:hypothetical protein
LLVKRRRETRRDVQFGLQISGDRSRFRPVTPVLTIGVLVLREEVPEALVKPCEVVVISVRVVAHVT